MIHRLIDFWPINKCNRDCYYCPARKGIEPIDHEFPPDGRVTRFNNDHFFSWVDKYCDPKTDVFNGTGGEPGLYGKNPTQRNDGFIRNLKLLIYGLTVERGFKMVMQTNGTLEIPSSPNLVRTAAWHFDERPIYYDSIIIIKLPGWFSKVKWCEENNVPYRVTNLNEEFRGGGPGILNDKPTRFTHYCFINAYGQISKTGCYDGDIYAEDYAIRDLSPPIWKNLKSTCPCCGNAAAVERAFELSGIDIKYK